MHPTDPAYLPTLKLQRFSAHGDGMHVEVVSPAEGEAQPLVTFRVDEALGRQVVLHLGDRDVAFPLDELKRAIAFAELEAHPESFFDRD